MTSRTDTEIDAARATAVPAAGGRSTFTKRLAGSARYGMVAVFVLLALGASLIYPGFLSPANVNDMIAQVVPVGIVAIGMTYVMIGGGFDLSVTAVFAAASCSYAALANSQPMWVAFALTVVLGVFCGLINGFVINVIRVNPFIATLSTSSLFAGATYVLTDNKPVQVDPENYDAFGLIGSGKWGPVWISIFILLAFLLVLGFVLARTTYGRSIYAIGGNKEAARLAGIRVKVVSVSTYTLVGACAAVGGMITASQVGVGQATFGANITLNSIAIVIIGGTSLLGGEGAMWRTAMGLGIWAMLNNLFAAMAFTTGTQLMLIGLVVLIAVSIDTWSRVVRR